MGLFNFFRGTPKSIWDEPKMRSMVCQTRGQQVLQQVKNLKAVSRQHDADNVVVKYFQEAIAQWAEDPTLPDFLLCTILTVVSEHSSKKYAISIHEKLLELDGKVDLRPVYFSLGSLYHNLSLEELGGVICHGGPDSVYARMPS